MMVVYHHAGSQIPAFEPFLPGSFGSLGVDIFFVISGFIMYITTAGSVITPGEFMMRRIIRVAPLYWLLTCLMCLLWLIFPGFFKTLSVTTSTFFQSLFFIPHYSRAFPDSIFPLLVPGWTLNYEMFFYALFALALFLPKNYLLPAVAAPMLGLVFLGATFSPIDSAMLSTYTSPLLLEFTSGVLLGKIWANQQKGFSTVVGVFLFFSGWFFLAYNSLHPAAKYLHILGATLIVAGSLNVDFLRWKNDLLRIVGDASYSIYLSHIFTLGVCRVAWVRLFDTDSNGFNAIVFAVAVMVICIVVGVVVYRYVENPLTRYLTRRYSVQLNQSGVRSV